MTLPPQVLPRRFTLVRRVDRSGVSGTGVVAHGVQWDDGSCVLRWLSKYRSTVLYDSLWDAEAVHGHGGDTEVVFLDHD